MDNIELAVMEVELLGQKYVWLWTALQELTEPMTRPSIPQTVLEFLMGHRLMKCYHRCHLYPMLNQYLEMDLMRPCMNHVSQSRV